MKSRFSISGLHRNVKASGWVSFFTDISSDMIYPLLPLFLQSVLGAGTTFIGLIEGAAETTASLLKLFSGYFSDKWRQRKPLVFAGYTLSSLLRPLMAAATAGWHVLVIRVADRIGKGIRTSPRDALIADVTPLEDRGLAFGFQRAMDNTGAIIGPLAAAGVLWWLQHAHTGSPSGQLRTVFLIAALPGLLVPFIIWRFIEEAPATTSQRPAAPSGVAVSLWQRLDRNFWTYLGAVVLFTLGNSSDAFLVLRAGKAGIPGWQIPLLWAAFNGVKASSSVFGGRLSDIWGRKRSLLLGWTIYAASYFLFGFATAAWQIWAIFLFYGLYYGCTEGTERAIVADLVSSDLRGTAYGIFHGAVGIVALPASLLFGFVWQASGSVLPPFIMGACFAATAAIVLPFVRLTKPAAHA